MGNPVRSDAIAADIARGEALSAADRDDEAIAHFVALAERYPEDARVAFARAGAFDSGGRERDAATEYERAITLGLPEDLLPRMYVQYGSTLRNVGDMTAAVAVLEEGSETFPDDLAIACFLALARHSDGNTAGALAGLIESLLRADANGAALFPRYQRSLAAYAADLRE